MINIKLTIEYEGTKYYGWQRQKNFLSIQGILEEKISQITQEKIILNGSGRTDAGVHALGQVANFKTNSSIPWVELPLILNRLLPLDIRIKKAERVDDNFHARYSATGKIYHYYVLNPNLNNSYLSIFLRNYVYCVYKKINLEEMKKASMFLRGKHDFASFACSGSRIRNGERTIKDINIIRKGNIFCFHIEADAFLYKMVRTIVGTLLEVGKGNINYLEMKKILEAKNRKMAGKTVPAKGLFLMKVKY
ncbi:tRNA pseudouridine(38-40) synthase TruA [Candidatus Atribacteria bacterium RBG_19FT_COMBO_35_14]|uniref:tRNA pseudouridine synthase A n=1 Tax=Candidatus Sediminicultor quintus TaxID=1797291 RepID=A0A1F5AGE7_9BACT|nr:MAG: tRNA pseudouridine(38-40) synthase TruA [Candidatus Atribacteria bacterium RBG_19FT_COMBO_35_14]